MQGSEPIKMGLFCCDMLTSRSAEMQLPTSMLKSWLCVLALTNVLECLQTSHSWGCSTQNFFYFLPLWATLWFAKEYDFSMHLCIVLITQELKQHNTLSALNCLCNTAPTLPDERVLVQTKHDIGWWIYVMAMYWLTMHCLSIAYAAD